MTKGGGSASTIIIGASKYVPVYALHSLEYDLGLARFSGVRAKIIITIISKFKPMSLACFSENSTCNSM